MADDIEVPEEEAAPELEEASPEAEAEPLPTHKSDLVNLAMAKPHRIPSYEAWAMTVDQLRDKLKEADRG